MILYRPVGLQELALIYDSGMKAFPARLPQQPIFYPVLQLEYARQTASGWNAKNGQLAGYVTEFKVEDQYVSQFETHKVGKSQHQELWIPAEEMEEFNKHIVGHIKLVEAHFGNAFEGFVPEQFGLKGKNAVEQFTLLANSYLYKRMDFYLEIKRNHKAVFLNFPFWQTYEFKNPGLKEKILQAIKEAWLTSFPKIPLPLPPPLPEHTQSVKQTHTHAQRFVDPVQEEITLVEETDPDAQHWVDPFSEELTPEEATDPDAQHWADPVDDEITPVEQTTPPFLVTPMREEFTPEKQTQAQRLIDLVGVEITPEEETDSDAQHLVDLVDEEITLEEDTDSDAQHSGDRIEEDSAPVEQTASSLLVPPVQKEIRPVEQTDSRAWVNPVHKESMQPKQTASHLAQGIKLGLSGKYREAIEEFSKAVKEDPTDVVARTSLGVAFHRLHDDDRALACYEAALKIEPKYAEAHYFRANLLYGHGQVREAIAGYTMALGLNPELIESHRRSLPQDRLTDYNDSPAGMYRIAKPAYRILHLNKLLGTNPRQERLFNERAAEYSRLWNYDQAIADYSSSLAIQPDDAEVLHSRGVAYEQLGQHDRAREDYRRAIAINPQLSDFYMSRGVTFGKMGNLRQAIASLTEGIRLAPENPDGYFNRGTAYFQQGDFPSAIDDFSNVIRLSPGDEAAYYWRGISHEEAGHQREAITDYRQFLILSRDENTKAEIEQKLSQWNEGKRNGPGTARQDRPQSGAEWEERRVSSRISVPEDRQKTDQVPPEEPARDLDLYDLIIALGERALNSTWLGNGVDCYGESAEELFSFTDHDQPIEGHDFLRITSGIRQTIEGDFTAFDPGSTSHWIIIRAWGGSGFYMEINDPKGKERLLARFQSVEEVEGAYPPYEGLFVHL